MWDLSSPTRDRTRIPCIGRQILNHWTTREVPITMFSNMCFHLIILDISPCQKIHFHFIFFKSCVGFTFTFSCPSLGSCSFPISRATGLMWPRFLPQCRFCSFCVLDRTQGEASSRGTRFSVSVNITEASISLVLRVSQPLFLAPLYRWGNWGLERLSNLLAQGHTVRN